MTGVQTCALPIWFGGIVRVGNQPTDQIREEIHATAMARMLNLTDVFELVVHRLDDGPLA